MMQQGKVSKYNDDRGFGFIVPDDGGANLFFHIKETRNFMPDEPKIGQLVVFEPGPNPRDGRVRAFNVQPA